MIKILKNKKGIGYVIMNKEELKEFSLVSNPKCDECFKELTNKEEIIYIPSLNEAYCKECGIEKLKWCSPYEITDMPYIEDKIKQINMVFNVIDEKKDVLEVLKEDKQRIENRSNINQGYGLLNQLYEAVPESYRDKISYNDETIYFDGEEIGYIDDINYIGCINGKICGRDDAETTEFDKFINVNKIGSYRNIFFTYKDNGEYDCEIIEELEKGKIYGRNENGEVLEVIK
ncbi:hypothetical protein [Clostridium uliginosum]|uniref:Uncharacterized protein n=1 Tax=Clostridium uliginosum TaxID=119641 RepID=A0A1I1GRW5_9CLOT|nr:hypothetical protein [Clostridium uliginosum]SFC14226.1 hypothetical protein SAMN05421842_10137 [Clostridium uliginosum]